MRMNCWQPSGLCLRESTSQTMALPPNPRGSLDRGLEMQMAGLWSIKLVRSARRASTRAKESSQGSYTSGCELTNRICAFFHSAPSIELSANSVAHERRGEEMRFDGGGERRRN
ncbi:unnamed protein product [Linum trigynum]|uniref:Uncharacterized protein n=1 Tax=Linum trigynum TaxID=586398 RepID=A0AAV2D7S7_9ROSI